MKDLLRGHPVTVNGKNSVFLEYVGENGAKSAKIINSKGRIEVILLSLLDNDADFRLKAKDIEEG